MSPSALAILSRRFPVKYCLMMYHWLALLLGAVVQIAIAGSVVGVYAPSVTPEVVIVTTVVLDIVTANPAAAFKADVPALVIPRMKILLSAKRPWAEAKVIVAVVPESTIDVIIAVVDHV